VITDKTESSECNALCKSQMYHERSEVFAALFVKISLVWY